MTQKVREINVFIAELVCLQGYEPVGNQRCSRWGSRVYSSTERGRIVLLEREGRQLDRGRP